MLLLLLLLGVGGTYLVTHREALERKLPDEPPQPQRLPFMPPPTKSVAPTKPVDTHDEVDSGAECAILLNALPPSLLTLMDKASISENPDNAMLGVASIIEESYPKQAQCLRDLVKSSGGGPGPEALSDEECMARLDALDPEFIDMVDVASKSPINPIVEVGRVADILEQRGFSVEATCLRKKLKKIAGPPSALNSVCDAYMNDIPDGEPIRLRTKLQAAMANPGITNSDLESFAYIVSTIGYKDTATCIRARIKERQQAGELPLTPCSFLELKDSGPLPSSFFKLPVILGSVAPTPVTPRRVATAYYNQAKSAPEFYALASALDEVGASNAATCVRKRAQVIEAAVPQWLPQ